MNIVYVYSENLELMSKMVANTQCHLNGSDNISNLTRSLSEYNARDVMGLIVHAGSVMTKQHLGLVKAFNDLFVFSKLPVVIVADNATELCKSKVVTANNCRLFAVDSIEGTISDVDLNRIFATIAICSGNVYDLSSIRRRDHVEHITSKWDDLSLTQETADFLNQLGVEGST